MDDLFRIGQITSAHGIKGDVKVYPVTSDPERFIGLKSVLVAREGEEEHTREMKVTKASHFKNLILMHFEGVEDRNEAEKMQGLSLWVTRENALPLDEDEYYFKDLLDLLVVDEDGQEVGTVTDILETGSNDVLVVETADGQEILLPMIEECVTDIDLDNERITIHWMEGLR